ncbi:MAG: ribbon-helix-helix domain-containing protein [Gammaproteobacteria bacterium]|nr:ribbon-helix-helix domain-containing protein [Gammaproteobacteria bacterium]
MTKELAAWLDSVSRKTGLPRSRIIREQLEWARAARSEKSYMHLAGSIRGARDLSACKGFRNKRETIPTVCPPER